MWSALGGARQQHPEWGRIEAEDFRKAMASRLSARMLALRRERDVEFAAAPNRQGTGTALVIVTDKLARRDAEFGAPKYRNTRIGVRDRTAAHKGSLAGDKVGFAKPLHGGTGPTGIGE